MAVLDAYAAAGADLIELGVPFSDPLADGPVIHAAGHRGARGRGRPSTTCSRSASGSPPEVSVVPMVYANIALSVGAERFAGALRPPAPAA